jgi:hypothetical protein
MGHSVDSNITNRYIDAFPLAQQMEFNSRLLKLNDDADIMEELKGLTPEQIKALIALVKNSLNLGETGDFDRKNLGGIGDLSV